MEKRISVLTIITFLLFAVSNVAFDQISAVTDDASSVESVAIGGSLPEEKPKFTIDEPPANDRLPESEKTQTLDLSTIHPIPRLSFARPLPIKRHNFDKTTRIPLRFVRRHPCRKFQKKFMIPTKMSDVPYGNDMISSDKTYSFEVETLGDQVPTKWLEFKHKSGYRNRHHHHHDHDDEFEIKYEYDREKQNSMSGHHQEKREHKGGFMRRIRKFLKHTFD